MSAERPVVRSAALIAICTLCSRITGLVRDVLLFQLFGLGWVADAWNFAFQIPNLFRRLFGEGAIAAAFVPTFTKLLENDGKPAAWRLLAGTLALLVTVLTGLVVVIEAGFLIAWLTLGEADPALVDARRLFIGLAALMLPFMLSICVLALLCSVLNSLHSFVPAALTPIILNLFMIGGLAWLGPWLGGQAKQSQVVVVAACVLAAGLAQLLFILPFLRQHGVTLGWRWAPRDPGVRRVLTLMGPVILGQGVLALGVFLDSGVCYLLTNPGATLEQANWFGWRFAYPLREGALSAITCASRLYQFPLGVLAVSLGTAALPTFSRLAAREDWLGWNRELRGALRMAVFVGLLAGGMMVLIPDVLVRLLFEYREFGPADTLRAAGVLRWYGVGLWAFFAQHIVIRAFYSVGDVRTPLKISALIVPLNIALSLTLVWSASIREAAFAMSAAITSSTTVLIGLVILGRRSRERLWTGALAAAIARMLLAILATALLTHWLHGELAGWLAPLHLGVLTTRAAETFTLLATASVVYLTISLALRLDEPWALLRRKQ